MATATVPAAPPPFAQHSYSEWLHIQAWQASRDRQRAVYLVRAAGPKAKNIGPMCSKRGWRRPRHRATYFIVHDVALSPGSVLPTGAIVPASGAVLKDVHLCGPMNTRGQAKKALKRFNAANARARISAWVSLELGKMARAPSSIAAPEAPEGWWKSRGAA